MIFEFGDIAVDVPAHIILALTTILGFGMTLIVIPSIVTVSKEKHLFDQPNARKSHIANVPTLGGAAVFIGMLIPTILFGDIRFDHEFKYILISLIIIFFIGIKDDILIISPRKKIIAELFAIGIIVILGEIRITNFHGFLGVGEIPYLFSVLFTVFTFVIIINGFNLIDGIDGLASGVGILTLSGLGLWFLMIGEFSYSCFSFSASGALLAFFRYNVFGKSNKIFLGDTGSLLIGMIAAILTVKFLESGLTESFASIHESAPAIAIGLLIVPLTDTLRVFTLRVLAGKSPFRPDRSHIHHRLLALEVTHKQATFIILGVNFLIILISLLLRNLGNIRVLAVILPLSFVFAAFPGIIIRYKERTLIKQLNLLGEKSWIIPITLTHSFSAKWRRFDNKLKTSDQLLPPGEAITASKVNINSLKDLEPVLPDMFSRYNVDDEKIESADVEIKNHS